MNKNQIQIHADHVHKGNLILVNKDTPLIAPRCPRLMPMKGACQSQETTVFLETTTAVILSSVFQAICAEENIVPVSGYRDFLHQRQIYESSLLSHGVEFTMKYVALPGCSEHQTGLAIDLGLKTETIDYICPDFPYEGICREFRQKAPYYGFIERYKSHKKSVTGIAGEPWHFRYVGYPHSQIIEDRDFSLEEYLQFLRNFSYEEEHFFPILNGQQFEIFFVDMLEDVDKNLSVSSFDASKISRQILLDEDKVYQVSGNNKDGCIVTVWS